MEGNIYLMTAKVFTSYGTYKYCPLSEVQAKEILKEGFHNAIGHEGTAQALSKILGKELHANRTQVSMKSGDKAVIFVPKQRLPEGEILTEEEVRKIGFTFELIEKISE